MIRFLVRLAILAFVANAIWQAGNVYLAHFQFNDEVRQAATIRDQTDAQLHQRVLELAGDHDIPLTGDAFTIQRENRRVIVRGAYVKRIPLAPGFEYPWRLSWDVDTYVVEPPSLVP